MERKLIVFDIDGTLVTKKDGHNISTRNLNAIRQAQKQGHIVSLASGRNDVNLYPLAKMIGINDNQTPIVSLNGAEIFRVDENKQVTYLWQRFFTKELATMVAKTAFEHRVDFFAYTNDHKVNYVARFLSPFSLAMMFARKARLVKLKKDLSNLNEQVKKFLVYGRQNRMQAFIKAIEPYNLSIFSWSEVSDPKANIEVNMTGVDKAVGVQEMAKLLGIEQKDVIFFGDGQNDVAVLKWAGMGVAMGNALPGVAEHANEQTLSVSEDGIAHWLEKNILKQEA